MMKLKVENLNIKSILLSGACFRVIEEDDGSFTNILSDRVVNIKQNDNELLITSSKDDNLKEVIKNYFDLNRDYNKINDEIISKNSDLREMVNKCRDYRILNQDKFEISISYIISQTNSVKRISKSINEIANAYGKEVVFNNKTYHLFPTYEELKDKSASDFRKFGVGFRDEYIKNYLEAYESLKLDYLDTKEALKKLMSIKGIGLKVASCILLFGYGRLDVFPIDTWVKKYMVENYNIKNDQKEIEKYAKENFGKYSGLIIQYMFHSQRNIN